MQEQVREINLEIGRPAAAQALERMRMELRLSKKRGYTAVKLIHGFGSGPEPAGRSARRCGGSLRRCSSAARSAM